MPSFTPRRPWGCLLPLAIMVLVVAGFAVYLKLQSKSEQSHPAAAAPPDLCAAIGPAMFERLVPSGVPDTKASYSSGSDAACDYSTADGRPVGSDTYGYLHVRLLRYGQIGWKSGADLADDAQTSACAGSASAGPYHGASGLGDKACAVYSDEGPGGTAHGSMVMRRGADVFWVDYYTHPGAANRAERAVTEVAQAALAGVR
ncbi:hypothetical protein F3087_16585 [Nocardia colli]|uniref:DUF3558 domain-containing protein n=1 Tax=Nocardia colli TaxID=2545717 RepID=A0A5N0EGV6_9NOCA|nr:hypothetical protein [Nocardia colli]KAA8888608.1 hypothetical protein F3087_16585 [Nocardia colli]